MSNVYVYAIILFATNEARGLSNSSRNRQAMAAPATKQGWLALGNKCNGSSNAIRVAISDGFHDHMRAAIAVELK